MKLAIETSSPKSVTCNIHYNEENSVSTTTAMAEASTSKADRSSESLSIVTEDAVTPMESFLPDPQDKENNAPAKHPSTKSSSSPEADSTYMIRSISSTDYLTLLRGEVVLAPSGVQGSQYWECVKLDGWLGFRNVASYGFLGREGSWALCCGAQNHREWEKFHIVNRDEGFVMLMTHWGKLRPVDFRDEQGGGRKLAMVEVESDNGILWEFLKV
jgi:hypothetical protein